MGPQSIDGVGTLDEFRKPDGVQATRSMVIEEVKVMGPESTSLLEEMLSTFIDRCLDEGPGLPVFAFGTL